MSQQHSWWLIYQHAKTPKDRAKIRLAAYYDDRVFLPATWTDSVLQKMYHILSDPFVLPYRLLNIICLGWPEIQIWCHLHPSPNEVCYIFIIWKPGIEFREIEKFRDLISDMIYYIPGGIIEINMYKCTDNDFIQKLCNVFKHNKNSDGKCNICRYYDPDSSFSHRIFSHNTNKNYVPWKKAYRFGGRSRINIHAYGPHRGSNIMMSRAFWKQLKNEPSITQIDNKYYIGRRYRDHDYHLFIQGIEHRYSSGFPMKNTTLPREIYWLQIPFTEYYNVYIHWNKGHGCNGFRIDMCESWEERNKVSPKLHRTPSKYNTLKINLPFTEK